MEIASSVQWMSASETDSVIALVRKIQVSKCPLTTAKRMGAVFYYEDDFPGFFIGLPEDEKKTRTVIIGVWLGHPYRARQTASQTEIRKIDELVLSLYSSAENGAENAEDAQSFQQRKELYDLFDRIAKTADKIAELTWDLMTRPPAGLIPEKSPAAGFCFYEKRH